MLQKVYLNQLGTSYWHCSCCSNLSYKGSPGVPRYSEVCLDPTTFMVEKRRSASANKDMPCSKQIQKGNIKGHLGDEKGNCCTWQYTCRHIHLGMYIYTTISIPTQTCDICTFKHSLPFYQSGVRPESLNAQSLYSTALYSQSLICFTTMSSCCSCFSQAYQPCIINSGETPC